LQRKPFRLFIYISIEMSVSVYRSSVCQIRTLVPSDGFRRHLGREDLGLEPPAKTRSCKLQPNISLMLPPGEYKRGVGQNCHSDSAFCRITLVLVRITIPSTRRAQLLAASLYLPAEDRSRNLQKLVISPTLLTRLPASSVFNGRLKASVSCTVDSVC